MTDTPMTPSPEELEFAAQQLATCRNELSKLFIGQNDLVDGVLRAVIAGGHVLVESVPGLGKTLLVKAIGKILGLATNRIQFTPDLMPADITGSHVFDLAERKFVFHKGPIFTQFLLADEINRAPAKTHAALLEVMQERQVTLDGRHHALDAPFLVMATQNPIENEGTYALPEAQLDRFLFKLEMTYPEESDEQRILSLYLSGRSPESILANDLHSVLSPDGVLSIQHIANRLTVDASIITYITNIVRRTRGFPGLFMGASPRAGIAMLRAGRATALSNGRSFVIPDDIAEVALASLRHRVILSPEAEVEGKKVDSVLKELLKGVDVPRGTNK